MKKLLYLISLISLPLFGAEYVVGPFEGLNNTNDPLTTSANQAQDLLNVDITQNGKSVKKREGYGQAYTLPITTSVGHGAYAFYNDSGSDVQLYFNDQYASMSVSGGSLTTLFSTGPVDATYQCIDSQGEAYCVSTGRGKPFYVDGSTYTDLQEASTGTIIAVSRDRLAIAGMDFAPSRIDFSAQGDFTDWTLGSLNSSPNQITISASGSGITHLTYAFGRWVWFKNQSFGTIQEGPTLLDWTIDVISNNVGTNDNASYYDFQNGVLQFRGADGHIYIWDGAYRIEKLTRDLEGTVNVSQSRVANSWIQTSQNDFDLGDISTATWLSTSISVGDVVLSTNTPVDAFSDTTSSDFNSGTLTQVTADEIDGAIVLQFDTTTGEASKDASTVSSANQLTPSETHPTVGQQFSSTSTYLLTSVTIPLCKEGSPGDLLFQTWSDSSNTLGTVISTGVISASSISGNCFTGPTGYTDVNTTLSYGTTIYPNTKYWITISTDSGTFDGANFIGWKDQITGGPYNSYVYNNSAYTLNIFTEYILYGKGRYSSGNIVSQSFDVGFTTVTWLWDWDYITVGGSTNDQTVTYETQTSTSGTGGWESLTSVSSGSAPTSTVQRYIRYKATLNSTDGSTGPVITDISIGMTDRIRPGATFYSQVNNAPNLTSWDTLGGNLTESSGTITLYVRAATYTFVSTDTTPSWTEETIGNVISASTGTYLQFKAEFLATDSSATLKLEDLTLNWFEGQATDKAYVEKLEDAIWWSVAVGTGQTTNNRVLRYDLRNQLWTVYDIANNGMLIRNNSLYFVSSSTGVVYKFGDTEDDAGSDIEAYWKSKDLFFDSFFLDKDFKRLSVLSDSINNSSFTVTYNVDASSETSYTIYSYDSSNGVKVSNKNLPLGKTGKTLSIKLGNDASDQQFEIFAIQIGYEPKSWRPE